MWSRGGGGGVGQEKVDRRPPTASKHPARSVPAAASSSSSKSEQLRLSRRGCRSCSCRIGELQHWQLLQALAQFFIIFGAGLEIWLCLIDLPAPCKEALDFVVATVFVFLSRTESLPIIRIPQLLQVNKGWWPLTSRFVRKDSEDEDDGKKTTLDWLGGGWVGLQLVLSVCKVPPPARRCSRHALVLFRVRSTDLLT